MCEASNRMQRVLQFPSSLNKIFDSIGENVYNPTENPNGIISLNMSVNDCVWDIVGEKLQSVDLSRMPRSYIHYEDFQGAKHCREAIAKFFTR